MKDIKINSKLDEETAQELRDKLRARSQKQIWLMSGFIGCIDGAEDLSTNYKHYLAEAFEENTPIKNS